MKWNRFRWNLSCWSRHCGTFTWKSFTFPPVLREIKAHKKCGTYNKHIYVYVIIKIKIRYAWKIWREKKTLTQQIANLSFIFFCILFDWLWISTLKKKFHFIIKLLIKHRNNCSSFSFGSAFSSLLFCSAFNWNIQCFEVCAIITSIFWISKPKIEFRRDEIVLKRAMSNNFRLITDYTFQRIYKFIYFIANCAYWKLCSMFEHKVMFYLRTFLKEIKPNVFLWQIEISQFNNWTILFVLHSLKTIAE